MVYHSYPWLWQNPWQWQEPWNPLPDHIVIQILMFVRAYWRHSNHASYQPDCTAIQILMSVWAYWQNYDHTSYQPDHTEIQIFKTCLLEHFGRTLIMLPINLIKLRYRYVWLFARAYWQNSNHASYWPDHTEIQTFMACLLEHIGKTMIMLPISLITLRDRYWWRVC